MTHRSRLRSILSDEDLEKINEVKNKKLFPMNYPSGWKDFLGDDYFDVFDSDEEELPIWSCNGCNWVGNGRPIGGECPRCMCAVEEEYL